MRKLLISFTFFFGTLIYAADASYDPLEVDESQTIETLDLLIDDTRRDRKIPLRVYLPESSIAAPVVLFSHGLGGSKDNNPYLGNHWAARSYIAVFMQHIGSDESVWKDAKPRERMKAMKRAASMKNARLRYQDVPVVIDYLEQWNNDETHALHAKLDLEDIGMSGHSFGAVTTQAVSGQSGFGGLMNFTDDRIKAAVAMSPSTPRGRNTKRTFKCVNIPWLLMTGTEDLSVIGNTDLASRLAVFPALPDGDKYELVLFEAEHSAFSDRSLPGDKLKRNPNHHQAILALSTAFWDAYLNNNDSAKAWLQGDGVKSALEGKDRWQTK
jgi:predicted dienelactone hydrolase